MGGNYKSIVLMLMYMDGLDCTCTHPVTVDHWGGGGEVFCPEVYVYVYVYVYEMRHTPETQDPNLWFSCSWLQAHLPHLAVPPAFRRVGGPRIPDRLKLATFLERA